MVRLKLSAAAALVLALVCGLFAHGSLQAQEAPKAKPGETHLRPAKLPKITPPVMAEESQTIKLPGNKVNAVAVGGGGRYLIFFFKEEKKLEIFDVSALKFTNSIALESSEVGFTAGAEKLILLFRDTKTIERWDLATVKRELSKAVVSERKLSAPVMGNASNGPILVGTEQSHTAEAEIFLDLDTLECAAIQVERGDWGTGSSQYVVKRASANGRLFTLFNTVSRGRTAVTISGDRLNVYQANDYSENPYPSYDGRFIYSLNGTFNGEFKRAGKEGYGEHIPAVWGDFHLAAAPDDKGKEDKTGGAHLFIAGSTKPLGHLGEAVPYRNPSKYTDFSAGARGLQRTFYIPEANVVLAIPYTDDQLIARRVNLDDLLSKYEENYLLIMSRPVTTAERGKPYQYTINVKSNEKEIKYQVANGPEGMKVSADGKVTWNVPANFSGNRADVILSVSTAAGSELFQNYSIELSGAQVESKTPVAPPAGDPPVAAIPKIEPVKFAGDSTTVKLPGTYGQFAIGAGGRYLILHMVTLRQLAVFDVCQAKVIKYIPLESEIQGLTAGLDCVVVSLKQGRVLLRYSLKMFEFDASANTPLEEIGSIAMGHASTGPLVVQASRNVHNGPHVAFYDGATLQPAPIVINNEAEVRIYNLLVHNRPPQVSADGKTIVFGFQPFSLQGAILYRMEDPMAQPLEAGSVNADGTFFYRSNSILNRSGKKLNQEQPPDKTLLALQSGFYLSISDSPGGRNQQGVESISIHAEGEIRPIVALDFPIRLGEPGVGSSLPFSPYGRIHYLPDAKVIVQLASSNDQVLLYKVDINALADKAPGGHLFVTSRAPQTITDGAVFQYQLVVKASSKQLTYRVESGPKGMEVSPTGLVKWNVPATFENARQDATIAVKDDTGRETLQTFSLESPGAIERAAAKLAAQKKAKEIAEAKFELANKSPYFARNKEAVEKQAKSILLLPDSRPASVRPTPRTWTDPDGNRVEARLVRNFAGFITLHDGLKGFQWAESKLGEEDQKYLRDLIAAERLRSETEKKSGMSQARPTLQVIGYGLTEAAKRPPNLGHRVEEKSAGLSWRVHILPYIGGEGLYRMFRLNEPWDSEFNKNLIPQMPSFFQAQGSKAEPGKTNFLAIVGKECVFESSATLPSFPLGNNAGAGIAVVEVPDNLAVIWTKPDDVPYSDGAKLRELFGMREKVLCVLTQSGDILSIPSKTTDEALKIRFKKSETPAPSEP